MTQPLRLMLFALSLALLVACNRSEPPTVVRPTPSPAAIAPLVLGGILDMSDDAGPNGRQRYEAATLAVELINRRGGVRLPNGDRRQLELRIFDDAGSADRAESGVRRLVEDGAIAIVGPSAPDALLPARRAAETAGIPSIALEALDTESAPNAPWKWTFALAAPPDEPLSATLGFFLSSGVDRLAWMAPRTLPMANMARTVRRMASGVGMQVVAEESYAPGEEDHAERLQRLQAADPRVILAWAGDAHEAAAIALEAKTVKDLVPVFFGPAASAPSTLTLAGEGGNGVRTVTLRLPVADDLWDHDPLTPVIRDFRREMVAKTGRQPTSEAAQTWDAARLLVSVVERVGTDRAAIRDALEGTRDYVGASGAVTFGPRQHDGLDKRAFIVARGEGQRWRLPP
ncbi:MAG: ABC transporter substrate-binding protein [Chloroflexi bacterium]|nr:ABC transporter substrate-binding protein [Chloroflexota bacterium]